MLPAWEIFLAIYEIENENTSIASIIISGMSTTKAPTFVIYFCSRKLRLPAITPPDAPSA